ncbi:MULTISPECIES: hypothetical protein [unclassified Bradyrhizobium]|uniref:hypothetical protein n=1 Tax=unclassified Bradyrhizobium TaxID=2631580 RepID=UPI002916E009|nr:MULTISPECIES: hypothetical protein [unclassified Bradyrhizobium]
MSIVSIMAAILEDELREHGILKLTQLDCETMVHSMIERTAELEADIKQHELEPSRSDRT